MGFLDGKQDAKSATKAGAVSPTSEWSWKTSKFNPTNWSLPAKVSRTLGVVALPLVWCVGSKSKPVSRMKKTTGSKSNLAYWSILPALGSIPLIGKYFFGKKSKHREKEVSSESKPKSFRKKRKHFKKPISSRISRPTIGVCVLMLILVCIWVCSRKS